MKKFIIALTFCGLLTQLTTAEDKPPRTPSPKGAKVEILLPKNGRTIKGKVRVVFGLRGMGVCPAGLVLPDGKPKENTGHHHLLLNTEKLPAMNLPLVASEKLIHYGGGQTETTLDLPPGKHTLQLVFADFAHIPHNPPVVSKKITIKVEAKGKKK
jgi:hypothetical protein